MYDLRHPDLAFLRLQPAGTVLVASAVPTPLVQGGVGIARVSRMWPTSRKGRAWTLHPAPCTLHPEPCTMHPTP